MDDIKRRKKNLEKINQDEDAVLLTKADNRPAPSFLPESISPYSVPVVTSAAKEPVIKDKVTVNFGKFMQLVATHDFEKILADKAEEEIILSSNLLTDLANAHSDSQPEDKKLQIVLLAGIMIGIVLTYLVIKY